ncbi:hypothetical protein [Jeotgalibacillus salarius]|uniref:Glycosyltransferase RgtA/B/C/D-like domain-containing protein n=1 Tax=Jeotgalibacillus salarius TaxID=546023 RepID=A0A4Y8LMG4_9BACL|nr:hypothetical protein [Jeotgalibacillus salarius]TFE04136.1 hypothetical protein E2626_02080 [Jeotgalibacillus salarius]
MNETRYRPINVFAVMFFAVLFGLFISYVNVSFLSYLSILTIGLLFSCYLSFMFRQPSIVIKIILFSLSVRVVLFIILKIHSYQSGLDGFFPGDVDALTYHFDAVKALNAYSWYEALQGNLNYTKFVAFLYDMLLIDMNIPQLINIAGSVLCIPLLFELGNRVAGKKAGMTAAIIWSLFPSAMFWSVSLLKDSFVVLGAILSCFLILSFEKQKIKMMEMILGLSGVILIGFMRPQFILAVAIPIIVLIGLQFLKGQGTFLRSLILIIAAAALIIPSASGDIIAEHLDQSTSEEGVEHINEVALDGGSGIELVTHFPPWIRWAVQYPFSLFAPFPWQWFSFSQGLYLLSAVEMIFLYCIYYLIWKNRKEIIQSQSGKLIVWYSLSLYLAVSFSLPNIGSIYRYRLAAVALLLPLVFITKKQESRKKIE